MSSHPQVFGQVFTLQIKSEWKILKYCEIYQHTQNVTKCNRADLVYVQRMFKLDNSCVFICNQIY